MMKVMEGGGELSNTKIWAISVVAILAGWVLYVAAPSLKPLLIAAVLAYLLHPLVVKLQKKLKTKKVIAVILTLALIVVITVLLINIILPPILNQMTAFVREFSGYSSAFSHQMDQLIEFLEQKGLAGEITEELDQILGQIYTAMYNFLIGFLSAVLGYIFKLVDVLIILILLVYFLLDGPKMVAGVVESLPKALKEPARNVLSGVDHIVWSYLKTQVLISAITGLVSAVVFKLMDLDFAMLLGIIAGVLNMIPYFGSIIGGAAAVLVALLTSGLRKAVIVCVAVLIIQQVLGNVVTPKMQAKSSGMHPVTIIAALLICNYLWGTVGMFISVPVAGLVKLLLTQTLQVIRQL